MMSADDKSFLQTPENIRLNLSGMEKAEIVHRLWLIRNCSQMCFVKKILLRSASIMIHGIYNGTVLV